LSHQLRHTLATNVRVLLSGAEIEIRPLGTKAKLLTKSLNKQQMKNWKTSARTAAQQSSKSPLLFRPAALAVILLLAAVFSSCEQSTANVDKKNTDFQINGSRLEIYVIDSCEYIGRVYAGNSDKLTHKGNCKFCATRHSR
jgi:hypothetical protein